MSSWSLKCQVDHKTTHSTSVSWVPHLPVFWLPSTVLPPKVLVVCSSGLGPDITVPYFESGILRGEGNKEPGTWGREGNKHSEAQGCLHCPFHWKHGQSAESHGQRRAAAAVVRALEVRPRTCEASILPLRYSSSPTERSVTTVFLFVSFGPETDWEKSFSAT